MIWILLVIVFLFLVLVILFCRRTCIEEWFQEEKNHKICSWIIKNKDKLGPLEKVCGYRSTIKTLYCPFIKLKNG